MKKDKYIHPDKAIELFGHRYIREDVVKEMLWNILNKEELISSLK